MRHILLTKVAVMDQSLVALALFAFVSTFTPGPNNMMLMASGANVGFRRTIPHMLGVIFGFGLMIFLVGLGLAEVFKTLPRVHDVLRVICGVFLVYIALKIARSRPKVENASYQPMTFSAAVLFQWVNPKGWTMALSAVSLYNPTASLFGLTLVTLAFVFVNMPSASIWAYAGKKISRVLKQELHMRLFNWSMALILVGSTLPMLV